MSRVLPRSYGTYQHGIKIFVKENTALHLHVLSQYFCKCKQNHQDQLYVEF